MKRKNSFGLVYINLLIALGWSACQPHNLSPDPTQIRHQADLYQSQYLLQEAAWEYLKIGDSTAAQQSLEMMESILHSTPQKVEHMGNPLHVSDPYKAFFDHDIQGIFKIEETDSLGSVFYGPPVYQLDRLLGFNFTPLTIRRSLILPDGQEYEGSLIYFIKNCRSAQQLGRERDDKMLFFDAIICNIDRHSNNWLIRNTGEIVAIDHDRSFMYDYTGWRHSFWDQDVAQIKSPRDLGLVYERLKNLPEADFARILREPLGEERFKMFLETRQKIITILEARR